MNNGRVLEFAIQKSTARIVMKKYVVILVLSMAAAGGIGAWVGPSASDSALAKPGKQSQALAMMRTVIPHHTSR